MLDNKVVPEFCITYKCNMNCAYCYAKEEKEYFQKDMDLTLFEKIISSLKEAFKEAEIIKNELDEITLLGGEPTCHPNLVEFIESAARKGIRTNLFTNGIFDSKILQRVWKEEKFQACFFHYEPSYWRSKPANIELFIKNLEKAKENNKKIILRFNTSDKKFEYKDLIALAKEYNADIAYSFTVPGPKVEGYVPINLLEQYLDHLYNFARKCQKERVKLLMGRPLPYCMGNFELLKNKAYVKKIKWLKKNADFQSKCPILGDLIVNPDGSLQLCAATPYIRTSPIKDDQDAKEKLKLLADIQEKLSHIYSMDECKECGCSLCCQGGCFGYKNIDICLPLREVPKIFPENPLDFKLEDENFKKNIERIVVHPLVMRLLQEEILWLHLVIYDYINEKPVLLPPHYIYKNPRAQKFKKRIDLLDDFYQKEKLFLFTSVYLTPAPSDRKIIFTKFRENREIEKKYEGDPEVRDNILSLTLLFNIEDKKIGDFNKFEKSVSLNNQQIEGIIEKLNKAFKWTPQGLNLENLKKYYLVIKFAEPDVNYLYHFWPPFGQGGKSTVALVIGAKKPLSPEAFKFILQYITNTSLPISNKFAEREHALALENALRSAVAAIMARNMSHNIGSHVLAAIDPAKYSPTIKKFNEYIQERMDFIAGVTAAWKGIPEELWFFSELLDNFIQNLPLIDLIVASHGYSTKNISFIINNEFIAKYKEGENFFEWHYKNTSRVVNRKDFLVAIPKGKIGAHAFYIILENMIRNACKYEPKQKNLEVHIDYEFDSRKNCYTINIYNNLSKLSKGKSLTKKINNYIRDEVVRKPTGEPNYEHMGITEMKICAEMLAEPCKDEICVHEEENKKYYLWSYGKGNYLKYKFQIQLPRILQIVDRSKVYTIPKGIGIAQLSDINGLKSANQNYKITLIERALLKPTKEWKKWFLPYRYKELDEQNIPKTDNEWKSFILKEYKNWIKKYFKIKNGEKFSIIISFSGKDREEAQRWKIKSNNILTNIGDMVDLYVVRTKVDNKNGEPQLFDLIRSPSSYSDIRKFEKFLKNQETRNLILYDNHNDMFGYLNNENKTKVIFQHPTGGSVQALNIFNLLSHPPEDEFLLEYLILNLLETALTKILVIDERIAEQIAESISSQTGGIDKYKRRSSKQGIYIPFYILNNNNKIFISKRLEDLWKKIENGEKKEIYGVKLLSDGWKLEKDGKDVEDVKIDICIIHQGVIDECIAPKVKTQDWFDGAYKSCSHLVITSGRGKFIKHVPPDLPFIEFSVIKSYLLDDFSKVYLVKALGTVKGGE